MAPEIVHCPVFPIPRFLTSRPEEIPDHLPGLLLQRPIEVEAMLDHRIRPAALVAKIRELLPQYLSAAPGSPQRSLVWLYVVEEALQELITAAHSEAFRRREEAERPERERRRA